MELRRRIAEDIERTGWLKTQICQICHDSSLADDLHQEILLIVLEYKPESALDRAHQDGKHLGLIRRIITNQYRSTTSPFWTKYRKWQTLQVQIIEETFEDDDDGEEDY